MKEINVYVMTHKKFYQKLPKEYTILHVGAALNDDLGYEKDNSGENISHKNRNYCELTGLYWMWKNSAADIVGLCHYRRYFSKRPFDQRIKHIYTREDIEAKLARHDIILPYPRKRKVSNKDFYCTGHYRRDYELAREAIGVVSPEYLKTFDSFMMQKTCVECNMFIAKKNVADAYCKWLFAVFDEMEKKVDLSEYSVQQARMYGFMAERLLNVWVKHNKLSISHAFLAGTEMDYKKEIIKRIRQLLPGKHKA